MSKEYCIIIDYDKVQGNGITIDQGHTGQYDSDTLVIQEEYPLHEASVIAREIAKVVGLPYISTPDERKITQGVQVNFEAITLAKSGNEHE